MVAGHIRAIKVSGTVWQVMAGKGQKERLTEGEFLRQGNAIVTAGDGEALLLFDNGSTINVRPNSNFSINEFMREPFDAEQIDYRKLKAEPSRSVTKVAVKEGAIFFDTPKLKISKGSSYNISNPVGTAGIRGTAGFVAQDSMGCTSGSFQATTQTGQAMTLTAGQTTGFAPGGNFGPPPGNAGENMQGAQQNSQTALQDVPSEPFSGAPSQSSLSGDAAELTAEQSESIEQAAKQGEEALVEAVKQVATESPEAAAAAAALAASLNPDAAPQVAAAAAGAAPSQAAAVAQSVAQVVPSQAGNIASAVTNAVPGADANAVNSAAQQGAQQGDTGGTGGGTGATGGSSGGGSAPALPGGFGGGGGGGGTGGGSSGGGSIYSN